MGKVAKAVIPVSFEETSGTERMVSFSNSVNIGSGGWHSLLILPEYIIFSVLIGNVPIFPHPSQHTHIK